MSFLKRIFGGAPANPGQAGDRIVATEEYQGHLIEATPMKEGEQWRLAARVSKAFGDDTMTHDVIRADLFQSAEDAARHALAKARQVIDEQGDHIYRREPSTRAGRSREWAGSARIAGGRDRLTGGHVARRFRPQNRIGLSVSAASPTSRHA